MLLLSRPACFLVSGKSPFDVFVSREPRRFLRWEMDIEGIPVTQAATVAFEAGLAEAISLETGDYTDETSTGLVRESSSCVVGLQLQYDNLDCFGKAYEGCSDENIERTK